MKPHISARLCENFVPKLPSVVAVEDIRKYGILEVLIKDRCCLFDRERLERPGIAFFPSTIDASQQISISMGDTKVLQLVWRNLGRIDLEALSIQQGVHGIRMLLFGQWQDAAANRAAQLNLLGILQHELA